VRSFTDVHEALDAAGVAHEIVHLPSSSRTARLAADALGVPVREVVKSLLFMVDGRPVLILVPGDATVDVDVLAHELGAQRAALARGREVLDLTGYGPGAVPPVALATDLPVVADPTVVEPDVVFCGGGTTSTMLRIASADLQRLLRPRLLRVGRGT
jgi:Cys-tRNA(Pro) deacylase